MDIETRKTIAAGISCFSLLHSACLDKSKYGELMKYSGLLDHTFNLNRRVKDEFMNCLPTDQIQEFLDFFTFLSTINGRDGGYTFFARGSNLRMQVNAIEEHLERFLAFFSDALRKERVPAKIFFSWQSDLENSTNRSLIKGVLEKVIKRINDESEYELTYDEATRGEPGAPNIPQTILNKIDNCGVFIADVSIVTKCGRPHPNPNVIFEAGYARAKLTEKRIVLIHNQATGSVEDLPFDISQNRIMTYELHGSTEVDDEEAAEKKKNAKQHLTGCLFEAITTILKGSEA